MPKCKVDRITKIINSFFTDQGKNLPSNDYDLFNDDIVDQFLDGKISSKPPKLIRQF